MTPRGSLSRRLIAFAVLSVLGALVVTDAVTYSLLRRALIERVDRGLRTVALPDRDGPPSRIRRLSREVYLEERAADGTTTSMIPALDGQGRELRPILPDRLSAPLGSAMPDGDARFLITGSMPEGTRFRVKVGAFDDGRLLILAQSLEDVDATLRRTIVVEAAATIGVIALFVVAGTFGIRRSLRPLGRVRATALAIAAGDHSHRVDGAAPAEIAALGDAFNDMMDQLDGALRAREEMVTRLRRFVADASHELRTPLAAVSAYAELVEMGAATRPDDLERSLRGITNETHRLRSLVDDLLLLASMDEPQAGLGGGFGRVDLAQLALDAIDAAAVMAPEWPVDLVLDEAAPSPNVNGDPVALRRLLDNLIANVRAHTPSGTAARVEIRPDGDAVAVTVTDEGPGIAPDDLEHVFDRFWRQDAARSRASGGAGLGLAIVRSIAELHSGTVRASSEPGHGLSVVVRLPAAVEE